MTDRSERAVSSGSRSDAATGVGAGGAAEGSADVARRTREARPSNASRSRRPGTVAPDGSVHAYDRRWPDAATLRTRGRAVVRRRWQFLAEAAALLNTSLDYQETLARAVRFAVPRMADYCSVALLESDGTIRYSAWAHRDPTKAETVEALCAFQPRRDVPEHPAAHAFRTGEAQLVAAVDDAHLTRIALGDAHLALLREVGPVSYMAVPLAARGQEFGVITFAATGESGRHYTALDLDLARRLGARAALAVDHARLYANAQAAARVRDELMAVVSHDLKNPLATIRLAAQFTLDELVPDDPAHALARAHIGVIVRASNSMFRLIRDLLDLSRAEAGSIALDLVACAPDGLVRDALDAQRAQALARGIQLEGAADAALPPVLADRDRAAQVFANLIGNAVKFTPPGGRVSVTAARVTSDVAADADVGAPSERPLGAGGVRFAVRDTGPGIAIEELPHVFDRYWQARKTARFGSGLGLAIVRRFVEAHGVSTGVSSVVGGGSTFWFTLPPAATPAPADAA